MTPITTSAADLMEAIDPAAEIHYRRVLTAEAEHRGYDRGVCDGPRHAAGQCRYRPRNVA